MPEYYYEMVITSPSYKYIQSFLDEIQIPYEEQINRLIIRDEKPLNDIEKVIKLFIETTQKKLDTKLDVQIKSAKLKNEDWITKYKEGIQAIEVADFYIHASWHKASQHLINIVIDPALAFGSGHHESTNGCLNFISKYTSKNDTLLDVGSGSGILAIAASKKGATVDICDTDPLAIQSAHENFKLNKEEVNDSWVGSSNKTDKTYDVVVANIIADVILMIKKDLKLCINKNGLLILSGILERYETRILEAFCEFELKDKIQNNEWMTFVFQKKQ